MKYRAKASNGPIVIQLVLALCAVNAHSLQPSTCSRRESDSDQDAVALLQTKMRAADTSAVSLARTNDSYSRGTSENEAEQERRKLIPIVLPIPAPMAGLPLIFGAMSAAFSGLMTWFWSDIVDAWIGFSKFRKNVDLGKAFKRKQDQDGPQFYPTSGSRPGF
eukprot:gnl/TRDRNA2_/TRDRNA2_91950_c0_seq1.p1 gnl/TRDRNA2_/TRDRNA2_91950_c0~~gnl/TRDRNA2_/TRDRNA2_91950_c0_seq1.p1  ORF type:complete len:163 (-),score=17.57 gnl/TRDRNA2_/TRDRNA2_91950_c0_seq1:48-536(-)